MSWLVRALRWLTVDAWRVIDARRAARPAAGGFLDWRPLVILLTAVAVLVAQEYWGSRDTFAELFPRDGDGEDRFWLLESYVWWSAWRVGGYALVPLLVIAAMPGERVRDYYVGVGGLLRHAWVYVALFALVLPGIAYAAGLESFAKTYPFYKHANRSHLDFWLWQGLYAAQFASLEFFFRGFMLRGLERSFGSGAIFVMVIPYTMIHFGKPLLETFGAIVAGVVLGTLAMRTRSIWGGALLHIAVALTMDLLAVGECPPPEEGPCPGRH